MSLVKWSFKNNVKMKKGLKELKVVQSIPQEKLNELF